VTIKGIAFIDGFVADDTGACIYVRSQSGNITLEGVQVKDGTAGSLFGSANAGGAFVRAENTRSMGGDNDTTFIPDMGADEYRYVPYPLPAPRSVFLILL
jgi:hypothetical protein